MEEREEGEREEREEGERERGDELNSVQTEAKLCV